MYAVTTEHLILLQRPDRYPVPHIQDITAKDKYFTKLDLISAYHQIPVELEHIIKMAINMPFRHFKYLYNLFGL